MIAEIINIIKLTGNILCLNKSVSILTKVLSRQYSTPLTVLLFRYPKDYSISRGCMKREKHNKVQNINDIKSLSCLMTFLTKNRISSQNIINSTIPIRIKKA